MRTIMWLRAAGVEQKMDVRDLLFGAILGLYWLYRDYILGIMEKKMEATMV